MNGRTHPTEKQLHEFVHGLGDHADIETHIEQCPDCFEKYIQLLELKHDRAVEPASDVLETIFVKSTPGRRTWPLLAAAGLLLAIGAGIWYSQRGAPALELEYKIGSCDFNGHALKKGEIAADTIRSGEYSVCDFKFGEGVSLRLLPVSEMKVEPGGLFRLRKGGLAIDRRSRTELSVLFDDVRVVFVGTRAVVSGKTVTVLKGRVEIFQGDSIGREPDELRRDKSIRRWTVDAGNKWRNGRVESISAERPGKESGPLTNLGDKTGKDAKRILAGVNPSTPIFFQTIHLKNGRRYTGLVYQRGGRHFVVGEKGTVSFPSSDIEKVQFGSP